MIHRSYFLAALTFQACLCPGTQAQLAHPPAAHALAEPQILVVANTGLRPDALSSAQLRDVFLGASSSLPDGSPVTPVLLKDGPVHQQFLNRYIGRSDAAFRASWRSLLFSGQAALPRVFDSEAALLDFVAHTPGAIGYIARATPHDHVKIIPVR